MPSTSSLGNLGGPHVHTRARNVSLNTGAPFVKSWGTVGAIAVKEVPKLLFPRSWSMRPVAVLKMGGVRAPRLRLRRSAPIMQHPRRRRRLRCPCLRLSRSAPIMRRPPGTRRPERQSSSRGWRTKRRASSPADGEHGVCAYCLRRNKPATVLSYGIAVGWPPEASSRPPAGAPRGAALAGGRVLFFSHAPVSLNGPRRRPGGGP